MYKILVVDDEPGIRDLLSRMLENGGYQVLTADSGKTALHFIDREPVDLVITDWRMASMSGMELLKQLRPIRPHLNVILMTAFSSIESAVEAMKLGARDYFSKPFVQDDVLARVARILQEKRPHHPVDCRDRADTGRCALDGLLGASSEIGEVRRKVALVAPSGCTVLITGETGTGKEVVARALHELSPRAERPFISVNCSAFPEPLLETELFGHVKGAFTGAEVNRKGLIEEAHGGTLFFDEVGIAPLSVQTRLLRVLEDHTIRRIGENQTVTVDIRVLAATNRDLGAAIARHQFREDLFYRLHVVTIHVPPLRARRSDIPLLADHFLNHFNQRERKLIKGLSSEAMRILLAYDYPGNVRELKHVIEQAVTICQDGLIPVSAIPRQVRKAVQEKLRLAVILPRLALRDGDNDRQRLMEIREQTMIQEAVDRNRGNLNQAARELGISRVTLWRRMKKFNIIAPGPASDPPEPGQS